MYRRKASELHSNLLNRVQLDEICLRAVGGLNFIHFFMMNKPRDSDRMRDTAPRDMDDGAAGATGAMETSLSKCLERRRGPNFPVESEAGRPGSEFLPHTHTLKPNCTHAHTLSNPKSRKGYLQKRHTHTHTHTQN